MLRIGTDQAHTYGDVTSFIMPTDIVGEKKCFNAALSWRNEGVNTLSLGKVFVCWVAKEEETNPNVVVHVAHVLQSLQL